MRLLSISLLTLSVVAVADVAGATIPPTTCSLTTACAVYQNTSSGPAFHAQGATGFAIRSTSASGGGMLGETGSGSPLAPGLEGESTNQSGNDAAGGFGLAGIGSASAAPAVGVIALGSVSGVQGVTVASGSQSQVSSGIFGVDETPGSQLHDSNAGVLGKTLGNGVGVMALANSNPPMTFADGVTYGVLASANKTSSGYAGVGVEADSMSYAIEAQNFADKTFVEIADAGNLLAGATNGLQQFAFDEIGNETLKGNLTTTKGVYVRSGATSGVSKMTYGSRATVPQLEDAGEAQLVNGRSFVAIDPAFDDVIDKRTSYLVFITPEGDSKGLYVSQKTRSGFTVREQQAGRSTLAFQYRILAKPLDDDSRRLAIAPKDIKAHAVLQPSPGRGLATDSALDRLRARLGPAGYARAIAELAKREAAK